MLLIPALGGLSHASRIVLTAASEFACIQVCTFTLHANKLYFSTDLYLYLLHEFLLVAGKKKSLDQA